MRITRHWLVAAAIAGALIISAGTRVAPGVFLPLLTKEFGWSRASIGLAVSDWLDFVWFRRALSAHSSSASAPAARRFLACC
jgi:hypothetical protein